MNTTSVYKRLSQSFLSHINQKSIEIYKHFAKKMKKMGRLGGIEPPSQVRYNENNSFHFHRPEY